MKRGGENGDGRRYKELGGSIAGLLSSCCKFFTYTVCTLRGQLSPTLLVYCLPTYLPTYLSAPSAVASYRDVLPRRLDSLPILPLRSRSRDLHHPLRRHHLPAYLPSDSDTDTLLHPTCRGRILYGPYPVYFQKKLIDVKSNSWDTLAAQCPRRNRRTGHSARM